MPDPQTVLVIGGTGAQGAAVVRALSTSPLYTVHILTRTPTSPTALSLASLPRVSLLSGSPYSETDLQHALQTLSPALLFCNTNGFALGEKAETYWGIRIFELAAQHHVEHFIWASLESSYAISGFDARFRTGHFEGKAKVADWIAARAMGDGRMRWSVLTSCMYLETLSEMLLPCREQRNGEEVLVFKAPVGTGRPPMIALEDLGSYAKWLFDNPSQSSGLNLRISTANIGWEELAVTFSEVTGKKAVFEDVSLEEYFQLGILPAEMKVGHAMQGEETLQTYRENFSGFWNTWKEDVLPVRDFGALDAILPGRVKGVGEWMVKTGYKGERENVLKDYRDKSGK